jgi:endonuclease VIII
MPEGDSVFRLARRLERAGVGRGVVDGELRSGEHAGLLLAGRRIVSFDTRGKHLFQRFDDDTTLHTHLRMQGSWTIARRALPRAEHHKVRVRMALDDGMTMWGMDLPVVEYLPTRDERQIADRLGPDPLRADWDAAEAARRVRARPDRTVVAALLDQGNLAGLGNLWVNELSFLRGVHPFSPVGATDVDALVALAARCLRISAMTPGMYQVTTGNVDRRERHWVVGRAGRACLRCSTRIEVAAEVANDPERRRTWWCPHCQPAHIG